MKLDWLLDMIFPKYCLGCGQEGSFLCQDCFKNIPLNNSVLCPLCGQRSPSGRICEHCLRKKSDPLSGLLAASDWENELLRQIIYAYKYNFVAELALPLSELMRQFLSSHLIHFEHKKLILVPVPLHQRRLAWRGFNQAELLAENIASAFGLELFLGLKRKKFTPPQVEIVSPEQRETNMKNAFNVSGRLSKENIYILIDDVCTTASTLRECARELKSAGAKDIWGFVLARG